jgi:hypothetical protein
MHFPHDVAYHNFCTDLDVLYQAVLLLYTDLQTFDSCNLFLL